MKNLVTALILIIIGVFYLSTIRGGHSWDGDFSIYIHHAKNIVEGISYENTGYIYNRFNSHIGPKTTPPVFPLLLAPLYRHFGLNLIAMKIEMVLVFVMFLLALSLIFKNELNFLHLISMIAIIGFNPYFWNFKDNIFSDLPFLLFVYLSFLLIRKAHKFYKLEKNNLPYAIFTGFFIYLSYGVKTVGILILVSLFVYDLIKFSKPSRFLIVSACTCIFLIILQAVFFRNEISTFDQMAKFNFKLIFHNLFLYLRTPSMLWDNGYSKIFRNILFITVSLLALVVFATRIRHNVSIFEIFILLYMLFIIIWPGYAGIRYLIPIIPIYIFYVLIAINSITFSKYLKNACFSILTIVIFISYTAKYTTLDFGPINYGVEKKESLELFDYIRRNTHKDDIFIFQKPKILALYTDRNTSAYHCADKDKDLWDYLYKIKATHVIIGKPFDTDREYLSPFIERYRGSFQKLYFNADFELYRISNIIKIDV